MRRENFGKTADRCDAVADRGLRLQPNMDMLAVLQLRAVPRHRARAALGISEMVYLCSIILAFACAAVRGRVHQRVSALLDARGFLVGPLLCAIQVAPIARIVARRHAWLVIGSSGTMTGIGSALILLDLGRSYRASGTRACALRTLAATAIAAAATIAVFLARAPFHADRVRAPFAANAFGPRTPSRSPKQMA